ncbi:hypothetical protein BVG16_04645 [Paenibacillus selenitireducens]|uniref:Uncharacterized protein n=1 Tax=Paenibacillus selenitireducens TaxID=1324314 RepID=A0A1T2XK39_9BACL|nr:hypothetical protein BVG16_04645 [Paenibacillus selenitireducens]
MSYYCPLCNGLMISNITCPACSLVTIDYGKLEDYEGPYSPYAGDDVLESSTSETTQEDVSVCTHLLYCDPCQRYYQCRIHEWS